MQNKYKDRLMIKWMPFQSMDGFQNIIRDTISKKYSSFDNSKELDKLKKIENVKQNILLSIMYYNSIINETTFFKGYIKEINSYLIIFINGLEVSKKDVIKIINYVIKEPYSR